MSARKIQIGVHPASSVAATTKIINMVLAVGTKQFPMETTLIIWSTGACIIHTAITVMITVRSRSSRILEKQNSLQMSQIFPLRASLIRWALLFKDSKSGTEEPVKLQDSHAN